jgi:hypothetical protein
VLEGARALTPLLPEELDPRPFDPLPADATYGGWSIAALEPGRRVRLSTSRRQEAKELGRKATVLLVALVFTAALLGATWNTRGDFRLVTFPVAGLLGVVALLALASMVAQSRRALSGVPLEVDLAAGKLRGFPEATGVLSGYLAVPVEVELSALSSFVLSVHRDSGRGGTHRATARLHALLSDGRLLQGPEAFAPDEEWDEARDRLAPLAAELARAAQRPLRVEYRWTGQQLQLEPKDLLNADAGTP